MENKYELVILAGSAGSLDVLLTLTATLRPLDAAIVIVVHRKDDGDNLLADLVGSRSVMPVKEAEDKETIMPGTIYIAPADYHLLIEKAGSFALDLSEKIHFSRPSIDVTMETAAEAYKDKMIAILLSGANTDGAIGMKKVSDAGGLTIIQDPVSAEVPFMPKHALSVMQPSKILSAEMMSAFLNELL